VDDRIVLYRIVITNPPTLDDMRSYQELGIPLRGDSPDVRRLASGISLFDSLDRARQQARRKPWLGQAFIAELEIPAGRIQIEKTGGAGHYTAWADPDAMLEFVRRVERV
jgi:hypothetical protein